MTIQPPPPELRVARRQKVLKSGKILLPGNLSVFDCTIRDLSATGAKLAVKSNADIPNSFRLVVPSDNTMYEVKVARRTGDTIGVTFIGGARRAPPRKW